MLYILSKIQCTKYIVFTKQFSKQNVRDFLKILCVSGIKTLFCVSRKLSPNGQLSLYHLTFHL